MMSAPPIAKDSYTFQVYDWMYSSDGLGLDIFSPELVVFAAMYGATHHDQALFSISQTDLAALLGISRSSVSRAMKRLLDREIVFVAAKLPNEHGGRAINLYRCRQEKINRAVEATLTSMPEDEQEEVFYTPTSEYVDTEATSSSNDVDVTKIVEKSGSTPAIKAYEKAEMLKTNVSDSYIEKNQCVCQLHWENGHLAAETENHEKFSTFDYMRQRALAHVRRACLSSSNKFFKNEKSTSRSLGTFKSTFSSSKVLSSLPDSKVDLLVKGFEHLCGIWPKPVPRRFIEPTLDAYLSCFFDGHGTEVIANAAESYLGWYETQHNTSDHIMQLVRFLLPNPVYGYNSFIEAARPKPKEKTLTFIADISSGKRVWAVCGNGSELKQTSLDNIAEDATFEEVLAAYEALVGHKVTPGLSDDGKVFLTIAFPNGLATESVA